MKKVGRDVLGQGDRALLDAKENGFKRRCGDFLADSKPGALAG